MKARIKNKLSSEWSVKHSLVFELHDNKIYVYEDCYALYDSEAMEDCTIEIEINDKRHQFSIVEGYIKKL